MRPTKSFVLRAMTVQKSKIFCCFQSFPEKFSIHVNGAGDGKGEAHKLFCTLLDMRLR